MFLKIKILLKVVGHGDPNKKTQIHKRLDELQKASTNGTHLGQSVSNLGICMPHMVDCAPNIAAKLG